MSQVDDQMTEVVFLLRSNRAVGEKYERALARQVTNGVIRIDPRIPAGGSLEVRARGTQLSRDDG